MKIGGPYSYRIERALQAHIASLYPRNWDEDFITRSMLIWLRTELSVIPTSRSPEMNVEWDAYKLVGKTENANGDIAFVVKIRFPTGAELIGTGFLEAKRLYPPGTYKELDFEQLRRHLRNNASHMLLLYDYEVQETLKPMFAYYPFVPFDLPIYQEANAIVLPSAHAIAMGSNARSISALGYPFLHQLICRYFHGLDLDFDEERVKTTLEKLPGGPSYVVVAHAQLGPSLEAELSVEFANTILGDALERLEDNRGPAPSNS